MKIKENLSSIVVAAASKPVSRNSFQKNKIGKVYGVITTQNTPNKELFEKYGGWNGIGTIFYLDYEQSKNIESVDLNTCKIAIPFQSNQNYPLIGELVYLIDGPSINNQINNTSSQKYYTGVINIWNNIQQNSPSVGDLGKTFSENSDIRNLLKFEGDVIYQGRKGNGIRFGSTIKDYSNINEWSSIGDNGDPITIMVNGYVTSDTSSLSPNIEEINKEKSSIYLTSTQIIPLNPGASIINPRVNTILPKDYNNSQIILNSDRITFNSKRDEILFFSKSNIELNSDSITNINSGKLFHVYSPLILLGTKNNGDYPTEPVLLGYKSYDFLLDLCNTLSSLAKYLSTATVNTTEGAIPLTEINSAGENLFNDVNNLLSKIDNILSNKVYTA